MIYLLEIYPDFQFVIPQPQQLAWVKEQDPKLYEKIKRYEKAEKPKGERKPKERKVDLDKKKLLELCEKALEDYVFSYNDTDYLIEQFLISKVISI